MENYEKRSASNILVAYILVISLSAFTLGYLEVNKELGVLFVMMLFASSALFFNVSEIIRNKDASRYTKPKFVYDMRLLLKTLGGSTLLFFCSLFLFWGQTDKPIEALNGIKLGKVYTIDMLKAQHKNAYAVTSSSADYSFLIEDEYQPTMKTRIYVDIAGRVTKVSIKYSDIREADISELENELLELAIEQYGGKPSYRNADLFDGKNELSVKHDGNNVFLTIAQINNQGGKRYNDALRETSSIKLRAMNALKPTA